MKTKVLATVLMLSATAGCATTVRSVTATKWIVPPAGAVSPPAVAPATAGAPATPGDGSAATAATAAPAAGSVVSHYYLTYWEGKCGGITRGCTRGDTKVKHCQVAADNTVSCSEDVAATKALTPN